MGIEEWGIKKYLPQRTRTTLKRALYAGRAPLFWGNRYECPVCGGHFRKLLPFGRAPHRHNVMCPRCGSAERHRLVWLWLKHRTAFFDGSHQLLHIAPELGLEREFRKAGNVGYVSLDLYRAAMIRGDITRLPFLDESFDIALCLCVLEHIPDDLAAMREIRRVLKPGGFAILMVPLPDEAADTYEDEAISTPAGRLKAFGQEDHVRIYGADFGDRLRTAGFKVVVDSYGRKLHPSLTERHSLNPDLDLYLGYA